MKAELTYLLSSPIAFNIPLRTLASHPMSVTKTKSQSTEMIWIFILHCPWKEEGGSPFTLVKIKMIKSLCNISLQNKYKIHHFPTFIIFIIYIVSGIKKD